MKFTYNSPFHSTLFKHVPQCENIIHKSTPLAKSRLLVPQEVTNSLGDALKNDLAKDFTRHRQKGNSSPVVTITLRDPFFGILIIPPLLQSVGIFSCSQIFLNKGFRMATASSRFALNSTTFRLSWPRAFPFFRELMAWMISLLVRTSVLMSIQLRFPGYLALPLVWLWRNSATKLFYRLWATTNTITGMHYMNDLSTANVLRQLWEKLPW